MKKCSKCGHLKSNELFFKRLGVKSGLSSQCKECKKDYHNSRLKEKSKYDQLRYSENKKEFLLYQAEYCKNHKTEKAEYDKEYKRVNRAKRRAWHAKRKAAKKQRTPKWLTKDQLKEIEEIYILAKELQWLSEEQLHVDHIIPLQGEIVSGLHVPWNLQILPASVNISKHNKLTL